MSKPIIRVIPIQCRECDGNGYIETGSDEAIGPGGVRYAAISSSMPCFTCKGQRIEWVPEPVAFVSVTGAIEFGTIPSANEVSAAKPQQDPSPSNPPEPQP